MKRKLFVTITMCFCLLLSACGGGGSNGKQEVPESVKTLQHEIDKALESNPTYEDIAKIKSEYNGLLNSEQAMITNYDKIEDMYPIDANVVSCIFAANQLKKQLKNPSSLDIINASCGNADGTIAIKLSYKASNNVGGAVENTYYCLVDTPKENNGSWSCKLDDLFSSYYNIELINGALGNKTKGNTSQGTAKEKYDKAKNIIDISVQQISDNIGMSITETK